MEPVFLIACWKQQADELGCCFLPGICFKYTYTICCDTRHLHLCIHFSAQVSGHEECIHACPQWVLAHRTQPTVCCQCRQIEGADIYETVQSVMQLSFSIGKFVLYLSTLFILFNALYGMHFCTLYAI
jgi:hypothetical protein